jgi:nitroreductase
MDEIRRIPLPDYREYPEETMRRRSAEFYADLSRRRSVREFSSRPVPRDVIENCIRAAGTAPSGANQQPWHFVAISDPAVKRRLREAAEGEEREFYERRAPRKWLDAIAPLGTDYRKTFLEEAPWLIAIFQKRYSPNRDGEKRPSYYPTESVGIATGLLIAAVHHAGLVSLTYTPSPMDFLSETLGRPPGERPFLLLVVGYPGEGATVPAIKKKPLEEISSFV